ncbi:hypothetical protein HG264_04935 [Pseudomonas sp. gcc21]|nr:hypothetical protein [Pseudomonas sp. gcc21]QJD58300.1 hypothetical protein HG264_04935 [Pseudomonas sp. gcc21]
MAAATQMAGSCRLLRQAWRALQQQGSIPTHTGGDHRDGSSRDTRER